MTEQARSSVRATREPLSRERVLATAMRLADAEGLAAVTMRRVAAELGVEAMSLYFHLPGKASIIDGLAEAIIAEIGTAIRGQDTEPHDWQRALRRRCLTAREVMLHHRWAPGVISSRSTIPPSLYAYYEEILAILIGGGVTYHLAHQAIHALGSMVLCFAQELFSPPANGDPDEDVGAAIAEAATLLPHLTTMVAAELHDNQDDPMGWCDSQTEFELTLDLILDGLARHA